MKSVLAAPLPEVVDRFAESILSLTPEQLGRLLRIAGNVLEVFSRSRVLLSPREREVYDRVVAGETNDRIAIALGVGKGTIQTYRSAINRKLGASSTADLVRIAAREGLL
jgi:DNA-binding CsgD family transcriptional regulator